LSDSRQRRVRTAEKPKAVTEATESRTNNCSVPGLSCDSTGPSGKVFGGMKITKAAKRPLHQRRHLRALEAQRLRARQRKWPSSSAARWRARRDRLAAAA
jgi:hypothetical protein